MSEEIDYKFTSLSKAAEYARVNRQAIFLAIKKGALKAEKRYIQKGNGTMHLQWIISRKDLDEYRESKYSLEKRKFEGQKIFDITDNRWSVLHVSKTLSEYLGRPITTAHIYYLLRTGQLRGYKKGISWVINESDAISLFHKERRRIEMKDLRMSLK